MQVVIHLLQTQPQTVAISSSPVLLQLWLILQPDVACLLQDLTVIQQSTKQGCLVTKQKIKT